MIPIRVGLLGRRVVIDKMKSLSEVKGKKIAGLPGSGFVVEFAKKTKVIPIEVGSVPQIMKMIKAERIDFGTCITLICGELIKKNFPDDINTFDFKKYIVAEGTIDLILKNNIESRILKRKIEEIIKQLHHEKFQVLADLTEPSE